MIDVKNVNLTLQKNEILKDISVHFERGKIRSYRQKRQRKNHAYEVHMRLC